MFEHAELPATLGGERGVVTRGRCHSHRMSHHKTDVGGDRG